jgi:hypothetical protein
MVERNKSDDRFTKITNCKIKGLYKKLPDSIHNSYMIEILYKYNDEDFLHETKYITIDQSKFIKEINEWFNNGEKDILYYTDGMGNIDIYKFGKKYIIMYSPNDGCYQDFYFDSDEFKKLNNWVRLQNK